VTDEFTERLASVQGRRRRAPMLVGSVLAPLGLVLIGLAWLGASRTPVLQEQVAYLISGGLTGVALVVIGSFLYFSHWQTEALRMTQAQTLQVVGALDQLQVTVDRLVSALAVPVALVATPGGSISHRPDCSVVRGRTDLRSAEGDLAPCRICQPR
jgi:hypothetical protein